MSSIFRVKKQNNYVVMNKTSLMDERLSWKAKGLHAYMLSMPDDWCFYDHELQKHARDGRDSLKSAIKELKDLGYMKRIRHRNSDGTFDYETLVFEVPHTDSPLTGKPQTEKPLTDKPQTENPQLLSNNKPSIDELNNNELTTDLPEVVDCRAINFYEQNFGMLNPFISEQIFKWQEDLSPELVIESLKIALQNQKKWNYAEGILRNWANRNVKTLDDVKALEVEFKNSRRGNVVSFRKGGGLNRAVGQGNSQYDYGF